MTFRIPRSLGECDFVTSCRVLKDKFILRGNNPLHRVAQFLKACRNVSLNGQQKVSHDCTICSELADDHESD